MKPTKLSKLDRHSIDLGHLHTAHLKQLKHRLDEAYLAFHQKDFIHDDPIALAHQFRKKQDIEIIAFWTAMLAWGHRKSIIKSGQKLIQFLDHDPHDFILHHKEKDRKPFLTFKHRTFQPDDALYFLNFLQNYYRRYDSLENAFLVGIKENQTVKQSLIRFKKIFFSYPHLQRTRKHISSPQSGSACKRLNMFLRWMVRTDPQGIDFGLWHKISPGLLMIPLDVHVYRVAIDLGLTNAKYSNWATLEEIMSYLRRFDPDDPAKYDFALFGLALHTNP